MGGAVTLLLFVSIVFPGCRRNSVPDGSPASSSTSGAAQVAAPRRADPALDLLFARIAGLPGAPAAAWQGEASWKVFTDLAGKDWKGFDTTVLEPMRLWAKVELSEARRATEILFYPFGGPDFVTSYSLFPEARETVLMGLEPVGNLPDLDKSAASWRESFFADLGELVSGFLKRGYFITREMNDIYSRGRVDGALPVIAFFLGRGGYAVVDVLRLTPNPAGEWVETPYEKLVTRPHRPYGVKILYLKPGDPAPQTVYYFSCDVANQAFEPGSPLYRFLAPFERMTTFVKSGSYLLHWNDFSTMRRFILDRSLFVLEDDTAVPYRFFRDGGWQVRLYGRYATPVEDFTNVEQPDLRKAYEDGSSPVAPLPFHFGYRWKTQIDNLLLAKRPRRPYKVPVVD
jgi:hypothetical protein